jgi:hypothetical protein
MWMQLAAFAPHLGVAALLATIGICVVLRPGVFAAVRPYFSALRPDAVQCMRLDPVLTQRRRVEGISRGIGLVLGLLLVGLALMALVPAVAPACPYALGTIAFGAATAWAYGQLQRGGGQRLGSPRQSRRSLRWAAIFASACVTVICGVMFVGAADLPDAVLVALGACATLASAWAVFSMPVVRLGIDAAVECFVDERLRAARATNLAGIAVAMAFGALGLVSIDGARIGRPAWMLVGLLVVAVAVATVRVHLRLRDAQAARVLDASPG